SLIEEYQSALYENGALGEIEHYYTTLQNFVPYDTRILEALKKLYETTGESSKLADVAVSLNILDQKAGGNNVPQQGMDGQTDSSSTDPSTAEDLPWGDEIDLSNSADIILDQSENSTENMLEDFAAVDLSSGPPETGVTDIEEFEIDISFDLPEDQDMFPPSPEDKENGEPSLPEMEDDGTDSHVLPETTDEGNTVTFEELTEDTALPADDIETPFDFSTSIEDAVPLVTLDVTDDHPVDSEVELPSFMEEADVSRKPEPGLSLELFRENLENQIEKEDAETHYNLGIAYMEMGLHDDAIKQFRIAANDPERELDCLTLHAVCSREKNDYEDSESILTTLLSLKGLQPERVQNLRYELGVLYMASGRKDEALQSFREIFVANPGFRDTMNLISCLSGNNGSLDLSDVEDMEITLEELE
ncbi:MAG: tetratricopeptide repeat protein, partial [Geobacteraceae bacterium]|nr:tetratricopeptide repeat protein [Geobacteraceae bacterium]